VNEDEKQIRLEYLEKELAEHRRRLRHVQDHVPATGSFELGDMILRVEKIECRIRLVKIGVLPQD
jgi:hypothetical protein